MKIHLNNFYRDYLKRLFDLVVSIILLLLFLPIMILIAFLIFIFMGRPVFYNQLRPGKGGKIFKIYKFRTMLDRRDASGNLLEDKYRLTKLGTKLRALSLDELPQILNVLKGDQSFVGPRPLLLEYLPLYNDFQKRRHDVRPGITGWAQINGRNKTSWNDRFQLDMWYVQNLSFSLDCTILFKTIIKVINRSDISSQGSVTMEKFNGNN